MLFSCYVDNMYFGFTKYLNAIRLSTYSFSSIFEKIGHSIQIIMKLLFSLTECLHVILLLLTGFSEPIAKTAQATFPWCTLRGGGGVTLIPTMKKHLIRRSNTFIRTHIKKSCGPMCSLKSISTSISVFFIRKIAFLWSFFSIFPYFPRCLEENGLYHMILR